MKGIEANKPYDGYKVYGPYSRSDGRKHVILRINQKKKTVSFPKYLVECRLGKLLKPNETVDHIDGDFRNNDPSNLQVLDRKVHNSKDAKRFGHRKSRDGKTKVCLKCEQRKLLAEFNLEKKRSDGHADMCRTCAIEYHRKMDKVFERVCPICSKEFSTRKRGKSCCSHACTRRYNKRKARLSKLLGMRNKP